MDDMRRQIDRSKEVLKRHREHGAEFLVRNQRYVTGKMILKKYGKILITGKAGQGKTYLAYQLLLKCLQYKNNARPLIISTADEWKKLADSSTELAIVVDDMCGKYGLLQGELKTWSENARFISALIGNRKHTVIFTMRTHIYNETGGGLQLESEIFDPLFCEKITLNLESYSMNLNEEDKIQFANKYLKQFGLPEDEVLQLCRINESSMGFPLLCRTAQSIEDKSKLFGFFTRPLEIMLKELELLRMEKSVFYGCLVLTMLAGGTLKSESINEDSITSNRETEVKKIFDSYSGPDVKLADIQQAANALCRTYLSFSESNKSYSFVHSAVEEAVFLSYGKRHPTKTLKLCSLQSVCRLCRINNKSRGSNDIVPALMLDLKPIHHDILTERFIEVLETKVPSGFANIAEANVWSSAQFRNLFMDKCKTIHVLADTDQNSLLVHAANANNCELASELLQGMKNNCPDNQLPAVSYLIKAAKASCVHKDLCLFKQFMIIGDVNCNDMLSITVEKGSEEATKFLLQHGADINYRSKNGESLLHTACLHGRLHMVKLLQSEYSLPVNQCDSRGRSICHCAASGGSVDILNFLVQEGADPMVADNYGMNLLNYACMEGKKEMVFHLMDNYSNMVYNVVKREYTVPHSAAYGGSIDIFKRVCKSINGEYRTDWNSQSEDKDTNNQQHSDLKARTKRGEKLLHMACINGKLEMVKYIADENPDMINEINKYNQSLACYAAAQGGNVSVLEYLIDQGLDPWIKTDTQETLLHVSCFQGHLEMTKYVVKKYPDMISEVDNCKGTPAHYAASSGNVSILKYLIEKGLDPWCRTATQETLLHKSCRKGQLEMSKYLVEKYPNMINEVDNCKGTAAIYAASGGHVSVLQYLIDQGLDPWCRPATQETLLHSSCLNGQLETTKYLVQKYPDMIHEVDNYKRTPAHHAASGGSISILKYLIDQGLDPWCRTSTQETLLHRSCFNGQLEMTKYLVEKYPDMINEEDNCKGTPAHFAAFSSNVSVLKYLIDEGLDPWCRTAKQETLLHRSCLNGQLEMSKYLVKKYPNMIHEVDNCKAAPTHYAAWGGNVSVLQYLIDQGLDPWSKTATQETLLHSSCLNGQFEMTKYLVQKYPNMIHVVDNCKQTPGHNAAMSNNVSILQYLIDEGLDPWCRTATHETLLHKSCLKGRLEMCKYLVEKFPDMINEVDNCKVTPAHEAATSGNVSILKYLIDEGLDPWCRTAKQETLLHKSCLNGQLEMSKFLVEKYPDMINDVDNCKRTPAHYAAFGGNVSVLQYVIDQGLDPWCRTSTQETLLHKSCLNGQLEMSKYLVDKYPDMINEVDNCKGTPSHYAASGGNVFVLQYLIDQGLDPWCTTDTQETLLHISCLNGQLEMSKYLAENYPSMLHEDDNCKQTPGHYAAKSSNISILQYLIGQGLDPWCRTATHETLLHKSCLNGQFEISKYLVEKYPNMINEVDNCKRTPGHYAAMTINVSILEYLIGHGLDPLCKTSEQQTLLHTSCRMGQLEMSRFLVEVIPKITNQIDNYNRTPAYYAACSGNVSLLHYLTDQGLDPWCKTAAKETLLHASCLYGRLEMTQYLVNTYPDMIVELDIFKRTPVDYAAQSSNKSVLLYLRAQGHFIHPCDL